MRARLALADRRVGGSAAAAPLRGQTSAGGLIRFPLAVLEVTWSSCKLEGLWVGKSHLAACTWAATAAKPRCRVPGKQAEALGAFSELAKGQSAAAGAQQVGVAPLFRGSCAGGWCCRSRETRKGRTKVTWCCERHSRTSPSLERKERLSGNLLLVCSVIPGLLELWL